MYFVYVVALLLVVTPARVGAGSSDHYFDWLPGVTTLERAEQDWRWVDPAHYEDFALVLSGTNPSRPGSMWGKSSVHSNEWQVQFQVGLGQSYGIGFWATTSVPAEGNFVGVRGDFEGLGIILYVDYRRPALVNIQGVSNNGMGTYAKYAESVNSPLNIVGSCTHRKADTSNLLITYVNGRLEVGISPTPTPKKWEPCFAGEIDLNDKNLLFGFTSGIDRVIQDTPFLSYFVAKAPGGDEPEEENREATPENKEETASVEVQPRPEKNGWKEEINREMWGMVDQEVENFESTLKRSHNYFDSLFAKTEVKLKNFEKNIEPLIFTLSRLLEAAKRKIVEVDANGQAVNSLETQIKRLEIAVEDIESGLEGIEKRLRQGHHVFDQTDMATQKQSIFHKVDIWFGLLIVQALSVSICFCWKQRKEKRRFLHHQ